MYRRSNKYFINKADNGYLLELIRKTILVILCMGLLVFAKGSIFYLIRDFKGIIHQISILYRESTAMDMQLSFQNGFSIKKNLQ